MYTYICISMYIHVYIYGSINRHTFVGVVGCRQSCCGELSGRAASTARQKQRVISNEMPTGWYQFFLRMSYVFIQALRWQRRAPCSRSGRKSAWRQAVSEMPRSSLKRPFLKGNAFIISWLMSQSPIYSFIYVYKVLPGEEPAEFVKRRARLAAAACRRSGEWHRRYAARVRAWYDHLNRPLNARSWPAQLLHHRGKAWLIGQRLASGSLSLYGGRTGTRSFPGRVHARWHDGAELAEQFVI